MRASITDRRWFHNPLSDRRGLAIALSLLILFLMATLILDFNFATRADLRAAGYFRDDQKAYLLARSAVDAARAVLRDDAIRSPSYDALSEFWATPLPAYPLGGGLLSGTIIDEGGKFNLNALVNERGFREEGWDRILRRLLELKEIPADRVDAIVDWIDADTNPLPHGAEDDYYQSLNPPYPGKNGPMETLSELRRVKDFDDDTFRQLSPYLTVYPQRGEKKININTADPLLIEALDARIDASLVQRVIDNRPWDHPNKLGDLLGNTYNDVLPYITVKSQIYRIESEGKVQETIKRVTAVVQRRGSRLPFLYYRVE